LMFAAISGLAGLGITVLIHESSTLLVALNALRLLRYS
jgi:cation transport ATPase